MDEGPIRLNDVAQVQWADQERAHETMLTMVWKRFRRHPGAIAGLIILSPPVAL
jgi:hypothetical protein